MVALRGSALVMVVLAVLAAGAAPASAQGGGDIRGVAVDSGTVEVRLVDGSVLFGRVVGETDEVVRLRLLSGDIIELRRERIQSMSALEGRLVGGEVWRPDPNVTRLFFGPTGRSLRGGSGYLSVYELVIPFVAVGVTDRITLAAGTPLLFGGEGNRPFWVAPKVQVVAKERVQVGVGVLHFFSLGGSSELDEESFNFGIGYAVGTLGDADRAVTIGAGVPYTSTADADSPLTMLGGEMRISRSIKLLTENYFFPVDGVGLLSAGPRFFGQNLTADLGLAMPFGGGVGFFAFPLVSFVYNW